MWSWIDKEKCITWYQGTVITVQVGETLRCVQDGGVAVARDLLKVIWKKDIFVGKITAVLDMKKQINKQKSTEKKA